MSAGAAVVAPVASRYTRAQIDKERRDAFKVIKAQFKAAGLVAYPSFDWTVEVSATGARLLVTYCVPATKEHGVYTVVL